MLQRMKSYNVKMIWEVWPQECTRRRNGVLRMSSAAKSHILFQQVVVFWRPKSKLSFSGRSRKERLVRILHYGSNGDLAHIKHDLRFDDAVKVIWTSHPVT